jgi:hypothetical protein
LPQKQQADHCCWLNDGALLLLLLLLLLLQTLVNLQPGVSGSHLLLLRCCSTSGACLPCCC